MHKLEEGDSKEMVIPNSSEKLLTGKAMGRLNFMGWVKMGKELGNAIHFVGTRTQRYTVND